MPRPTPPVVPKLLASKGGRQELLFWIFVVMATSSSSPSSFLNYFSLFRNGEEFLSNDHFIQLIKQYTDIYQQATQTDRVICCPVGSSLQDVIIRRSDLESHVLVPHGGSGEYVSLRGDRVVFSGEDLIVNNSIRTRVLDVEYPPNEHNTIIYRVSNMITSGSSTVDEFDEILPESYDLYIANFKSVPGAVTVLKDLDIYLKKVCKLQRNEEGKRVRLRSSIVAEIRAAWLKATEALKDIGMMSVVSRDDNDIRLGQVVETYIMNKIASTMLPWFKDSTHKADRAIHLQIMSLRDRTQSDLGVPAEFQTNHDNAIREICQLRHAQTPVDKLSILKRVSTLVRENVQKNFERNNFMSDMELATDDLITIIIYIIIQASRVYIDIPADIRFILKFHFVSSSQSHLGFTLCNFRVAIAWFIDQVMMNEKVTVVSNSIMLSPSFTNNSVFGDDELDFPRRPCLPVPSGAKKVIELISMFSSTSSSSIDITENDDKENNDICVGNSDNTEIDTNSSKGAEGVEGEDQRTGATLRNREPPLIPPNTHNFVPISSASAKVQTNNLNRVLYVLRGGSSRSIRRMKLPTEGGKKTYIKRTASRDEYFASVDSNGHLYTWGTPGCGRLGHSLTFDLDSVIPNDVPRRVLGNVTDVLLQDVSLGRFHGVALSKSGKVYTWGDNRCGQIGLAANPDMLADIDSVLGSQELEIVRSGSRHLDDLTPVRPRERTLISPGENTSCLLSFSSAKCKETKKKSKTSDEIDGRPSTPNSNLDLQMNFVAMQDLSYSVFVPRQVVSLNQIKVKAIACGSFHSLCLSETGMVFSWGRGANGRLGQSLCRLKGNNNSDQHTCLHQDDLSYAEPGYVLFPWIDKDFLMSTNTTSIQDQIIVDIAAGHAHSIATTATGQVFTWGCGSYGRLGHGDHCDEYLPKSIVTLLEANIKIIKAAAGTAHSIFLCDSGQLFGCGLDNYGQVDALTHNSPGASSLVASSPSSPLSLTPSAEASTDNSNNHGNPDLIKLSISSSKVDRISSVYPLPILVKSKDDTSVATSGMLQEEIVYKCQPPYGNIVTDIACGDHFTVAVTRNKSIYVWGLGYTDRNRQSNIGIVDSNQYHCVNISNSTSSPLSTSELASASESVPTFDSSTGYNFVGTFSGSGKLLLTLDDEFSSLIAKQDGSIINVSCGSNHALIYCHVESTS